MKSSKNTENTKNFLLVDTNAIMYRYGYAFQDMINNKNEPIGAIWGTLRLLSEISKKYNIFSTTFALDSSVNDRKIENASYKKHRKTTPDFLRQQFPIFYNVMSYMKSHKFVCNGMEADDTIGSLAVEISKKDDCHVYVLTTDKDLLQTLTTNCSVLLLSMGGIRCISTNQHVHELVGVYAEQYADFLALAGDSSDNIPGVQGIGPKAAINLLQTYSTLDNILENISLIEKPSLRERMQKGKDSAILSKALAILRVYNIALEEEFFTYANNHNVWSKNEVLLKYLKDELSTDMFLV